MLAPDCQGKEDAPLSAKVYKVRHDRQGGRIVYLKVSQGMLRAKETVGCRAENGEILQEKVNDLRREQGGKLIPLEQAGLGTCAPLPALRPPPCDVVGACPQRLDRCFFQPLLSARVEFPDEVPSPKALSMLRQLEEEDPLLSVKWEPAPLDSCLCG